MTATSTDVTSTTPTRVIVIGGHDETHVEICIVPAMRQVLLRVVDATGKAKGSGLRLSVGLTRSLVAGLRMALARLEGRT